MSSRRAQKVRAPPTELTRFTQKNVVGMIDREIYDRGTRSTRASSTGAPRRRYRGLGSLRGRGARRGASGGADEGGPRNPHPRARGLPFTRRAVQPSRQARSPEARCEPRAQNQHNRGKTVEITPEASSSRRFIGTPRENGSGRGGSEFSRAEPSVQLTRNPGTRKWLAAVLNPPIPKVLFGGEEALITRVLWVTIV